MYQDKKKKRKEKNLGDFTSHNHFKFIKIDRKSNMRKKYNPHKWK